MKWIFYFLFTFSIFIWLYSTFSFVNEKAADPEKHIEIVLRDIGHKLLLLAKDSTSRVLPIQKMNDHTYQISFEKAFDFVSDSLIHLVSNQLERNGLPKEHIVSVLDCNKMQTIFAYEIRFPRDSVLPCRGRNQTTDCYIVQIEFLNSNKNRVGWLMGSTFFMFLIGFYFVSSLKKNTAKKESVVNNTLNIEDPKISFLTVGKFKFYTQKNLLVMDDVSTLLSDKEAKLLKIFADNPNQIMERGLLLKEVWENEGIFVMSRNLDVLVSKLRKKLALDANIKITNVHGKGYKMILEDAIIA